MPRKSDEDDDWQDVTEDDDEEFNEDDDEEELPFGELPLDEEDFEAYENYMEEFGWDDDYFDAIFDVLDNADDSDWYES